MQRAGLASCALLHLPRFINVTAQPSHASKVHAKRLSLSLNLFSD